MKGFLLGVAVGAAGALWYTQTVGRVELERQFGQMQERANQVLNESRRILQETRQELSAALDAGKQTVQQTTERMRNPTTGETEPGGMNEPGQPTAGVRRAAVLKVEQRPADRARRSVRPPGPASSVTSTTSSRRRRAAVRPAT